MQLRLTIICLFFLVHSAYAQEYLFERYTPKDGLVNNRVRFFYQDSKGRLYISTYGGLSVYDGSRFINYTTENGLITSMVNDILEAGDDSLLIAPNGTAFHCLVHGVIRNIITTDSFYPVINQLIRCSDGYLYAIADQGLFRFDHHRFLRVLPSDGIAGQADRFFIQAVERNGQLFLINDPSLGGYPHPAGLVVYDLSTHRFIASDKTPLFYYFTKSPDNDIILATNEGIRRLDTNALRTGVIATTALLPPFKTAEDYHATFLYFDREGALWMSTDKGLVKCAPGGEKQVFNTVNGLPSGFINSVMQDKEHNVWFANDRNGIVKLASRQVLYYPQPRKGFVVNDFSASRNSDSVWLCDFAHSDLLLLHDGKQELFHSEKPLPLSGRIFIGKQAYLASDTNLYTLHFHPDHTFTTTVLCHDSVSVQGDGFFDRQDHLILSNTNLSVLVNGRLLQAPLGHLGDQAAIDRHNRIWSITRANILRVFAIGGTAKEPALKLLAEYPNIFSNMSSRSISVDRQGNVWVGSRDHGLYYLRFDDLKLLSWRRITMSNGLAENFVNYLECDSDNSVWASTPGGLDHIRLGPTDFTIDDLTHTNDNYQSIYRIMPAAHGFHWAIVKGGLMRIGPSLPEQTHYQPHLLFSQVWVGNTLAADTGSLLRLPYTHNAIAFSMGVTSFINEAGTRYSYRLEGSSNPLWSLPTDQSAINLVDLPPGDYTLRVKVHFLTGEYADLYASYRFSILPPWWRTSWFLILSFVVLAGLIIMGVRLYIRRKLLLQRIALEKKEAIEKERTRIATDMHDDLGAGLSRIRFLSETIGIKKQQQLPIEEEIIGIGRYSHEMIDKMGEIVWALNEKNDTLSDLLSYTRSYAAEYLLQAGIRCQVETPADLPPCFVSGEFRRNVYLTIKEALHNIVKHAQAGEVIIRMILRPDRWLQITITDDGIGFDPGKTRPFANGLNNMQRRIGDLGGHLQILGCPGTTIRISIPLDGDRPG